MSLFSFYFDLNFVSNSIYFPTRFSFTRTRFFPCLFSFFFSFPFYLHFFSFLFYFHFFYCSVVKQSLGILSALPNQPLNKNVQATIGNLLLLYNRFLPFVYTTDAILQNGRSELSKIIRIFLVNLVFLIFLFL